MKNYIAICAFALICHLGFRNVNSDKSAPTNIEYKIITTSTTSSLAIQVNMALSSHYTLVGGVSIYNNQYYQAMAK